jgi:predicted ATPase
MNKYHWLPSIKVKGYRPFEETHFNFEPLQVIVGANGSGKSSLFEFLRFIHEACYREIPSEIVAGTIGQQIFHKLGQDKLWWCSEIIFEPIGSICHEGELLGPVGAPKMSSERIVTKPLKPDQTPYTFLDFANGQGSVSDPSDNLLKQKKWNLKKSNQLGLGAMTDSTLTTLFNLREYIRGWRFYNSFHINIDKIKKSVPTSQEPVLQEDAGNLSSVLFNLMTEHSDSFDELKSVIKSAIPGFKDLNVKARGGPGEVIAFWQEKNIAMDLSLADLSDGTLRFIAWATLCIMPSPPTLICIDEPDQGVHPRTLPILAGLFEKASQRTQIMLATHSSYFLSQFELTNIAVMKKESGKSVYINVSNSQTLIDNLDDFGRDELEKMHQSDELEVLS